MPSRHHVVISPERFDQLTRLAQKLDCTLTDAIGHMLDAAGRTGLISRDLLGLKVARHGDKVAVDIGGGRRLLTPDAAARYASHIVGSAGLLPPDAAQLYTRSVTAKGIQVLPDSKMGAVRRGGAVKLLDDANKVERTITPSVASEFADQIREVADQR